VKINRRNTNYVSIYHGAKRWSSDAFLEDYVHRFDAEHGGPSLHYIFGTVRFLCEAAAAGVVGNLTYDALAEVLRKIRKPRQEDIRGIRFEVVVTRKYYNRVRRLKQPKQRGKSEASTELKEELKAEYGLRFGLKREDHS